MKPFFRKENIGVIAGVIVAIGIVMLILSFVRPGQNPLSQTGALGRLQAPSPDQMKGGILYDAPGLHIERKEGVMARYVNETYNYSFELFDSFSATEASTSKAGSSAVLVENDKENGFMVLMSPFSEDVPTLTKERILQDLPDMYIANEEPIAVAGVTGLCFDSADKLWEGNARECWFVLKGILYQFSTKRPDGALLTYTLTTFRQEPGLNK